MIGKMAVQSGKESLGRSDAIFALDYRFFGSRKEYHCPTSSS